MHETITNNYAQILTLLIICSPGGRGFRYTTCSELVTGGEKPFSGFESGNLEHFGVRKFSGGLILGRRILAFFFRADKIGLSTQGFFILCQTIA